MPNADASADDDGTPRDVELTSEPGADSTSAVRPSSSLKDGNWDKPRSASGPQPLVPPRPGPAAPRPTAPVPAASAGLPPLPPLPVPAAPLPAPPPSVAPPPPSAPPVGMTLAMPSASALAPRPIPSVDPRPITSADLVDDVRPPSLLASLAATRPTNAWLSLGMVLVGVGFVVGLLLGRTSGPAARAVPEPSVVSAKPEPSAAPASPPSRAATPPPAVTPVDARPAPQPEPAAAAPAASAPASVASGDATKSPPAKPQLEPFNAKAAHINLGNAAARAMRCREATAPIGTVSTVVTFIPSGRVADVTVTTPAYAGTRTGKCIIAKLKGAQVPPYSGQPETLKKTITLK